MSKIIKVVGGRHYVEGGPKCNQIFWEKDPMEVPESRNQISTKPHGPECSACNGTGLQAVELWPDAELDRWLAEHFETWDLRMRRELHTNEPTYFVEGEPFIINPPCADTSRGAKVAAVIAVAEEE